MILTPIDTLKTTLQVQGARGTTVLRQRIKANGIGSLWWGAFATAAATFVGHYPWFATVSPASMSEGKFTHCVIVQFSIRKYYGATETPPGCVAPPPRLYRVCGINCF